MWPSDVLEENDTHGDFAMVFKREPTFVFFLFPADQSRSEKESVYKERLCCL